MNTTIRALTISAFLALPAGAAAAVDTQPGVPPTGWGTAMAEVYHSVTGRPLAGVPVVVVRVILPDEQPDYKVFITDKDGIAFLAPLEDGTYDAYVEYNLRRSNVERFEINSVTDFQPIVTLFFNPDIDGGD